MHLLGVSLTLALSSTAVGQAIQVRGNIATLTEPVRYCSVTFIDQADTTRRFSALTDTLGNYRLGVVTSVPDRGVEQSSAFVVAQNYPNPFNGETAIAYRLRDGGDVVVKIYNILGEEVRTLLTRRQNSGVHQIVWDGRDEFGRKVSTGVYFYRIEVKGGSQVKKMVHMSEGIVPLNLSLKESALMSSSKLHEERAWRYSNSYRVLITNTDSTRPLIQTMEVRDVFVRSDTTIDFVVDVENRSKGKLVFVMFDSTVGVPGIYTMNLDGSELKPVAVVGDTIYYPGTWGDHVVIGSPYVRLPRWSPDGKKIICELMFGWGVLMLMNADGTNKHVLSKVRSGAVRPQWSPEGNRILFMRNAFGGPTAIAVVDTSGENDRNFTIAGKLDPYIFKGDSLWFLGNISWAPVQWGPTGNLICALASINKEPYANEGFEELNVEIFSIDAESGIVLERISRNNVQEWFFKLSPDGKSVIFRGEYLDQPLNVMSLVDNSLIQIPTGGLIDSFYNWSSDSRKIVFARNDGPDSYSNVLHLYMVDIDRSNEINRLTSFLASEPDLFVPIH